MHYLVNAFLFFFIYYLIWFLGSNGEPITHDTWVLLLLKYDDKKNTDCLENKNGYSTQDPTIWSKIRTRLHQSIVEN
jgi:hypothetical protein